MWLNEIKQLNKFIYKDDKEESLFLQRFYKLNSWGIHLPRYKRGRPRKLNREYTYAENYPYMLLQQDNRCLICNITEEAYGRKFCIDHDHKTGLVRGLLCNNCNSGIGFLRDDTNILLSAIKYLKSNQAK